MTRHALPMTKANRERIEECLRSAGFEVAAHQSLNGGRTLRCAKGGVAVLLSSHQPLEWVDATDARKDLVVVGVAGASVFKFWTRKAQERQCDRVIEALRSLEWKP